jgi:hypothetical protein
LILSIIVHKFLQNINMIKIIFIIFHLKY